MRFLKIFKRKEPKKEDWTKLFPSEIVDPLLDEIRKNPQASYDDEIASGFGEFGLEKTNPIPVYGIPSNEEYLRSLRTVNDEILSFRRSGSITVSNIRNRVDEYEIFNPSGDVVAYIYISPYHWKTSSKTPIGFYKKGKKRRTVTEITHPLKNFIPESAYAEYLKTLKKQKEKEKEKGQDVQIKKEVLDQALTEETAKQTIFKYDWKDLENILSINNINCLFHFTDRANLTSIIENGGLFSWYHCLQNNIDIPVPGGNQLSRDLDYNNDLQNYVRVSFTRNHPMMFAAHNRHKNNVILEINPEVIYLKGSLYADKNATRNDVHVGGNIEDFRRLRFDLFKHPNHFNIGEVDKPFYQGEILIPTSISIEHIRNVETLSNAYNI